MRLVPPLEKSSLGFHLEAEGDQCHRAAQMTRNIGATAATRMRALARTMRNPDAAILMTDLAADYDKLAERAAIRANGKKPSPNGKPRHA
jgi:hypothetical protein